MTLKLPPTAPSWAEAVAEWSGMTPAQQVDLRISQVVPLTWTDAVWSAVFDFPAAFSVWDALWFGLAIVTAFSVARRGEVVD